MEPGRPGCALTGNHGERPAGAPAAAARPCRALRAVAPPYKGHDAHPAWRAPKLRLHAHTKAHAPDGAGGGGQFRWPPLDAVRLQALKVNGLRDESAVL